MSVDNYWGDSAGGIMTVHHLAGYLRLSEAKIYRLAQTGDLPAFRIGKTWRFNKGRIDEWISERTEVTAVRPGRSTPLKQDECDFNYGVDFS